MCNAYNHPPGCTCGWGGEGHAGVSYGSPREWIAGDFTRPTTCPECGAEVFFIRHNGGSVWVDELGWPWPKHPCMDRQVPAHAFSVWTAKAEGLLNPKLGVITRLEPATIARETVYEIELADKSTISISLRYDPPESSMIGALVVVSEESGMLLHRTYAEIPFAFATNTIGFPLGGATPEQERIFEAICLVAKKAWEAVAKINDGLNGQFAVAKEEALRLIQTLSPLLQRSVLNYYASRNWEPLKRRRRYYLSEQRDEKPKSNGAGVAKKVRPTEEEIRIAMDAVAKQVWSTVTDTPEPARFKLAKVEARRLIKQLPPGLSGQVEHRLAHQGWEALKQRGPSRLLS